MSKCPKCNQEMSHRQGGLTVNPANLDKKEPKGSSVSVCTNNNCGHIAHRNK